MARVTLGIEDFDWHHYQYVQVIYFPSCRISGDPRCLPRYRQHHLVSAEDTRWARSASTRRLVRRLKEPLEQMRRKPGQSGGKS